MEKKSFMLLLMVILLLAGCSMEEQASETGNNDITEEKTVIESSKDNGSGYIGNILLSNLTDFSEGRAMVQFVDTAGGIVSDFQGTDRAALIDTQGKILWQSELTNKDKAFEEVCSFKDGSACYIFNGNDKSRYFIIDTDGNITFTKDYSDDFIILGYGDGLFLTAEHIVNFDEDEWRIGTIDKNGDVAAAYKAYEIGASPMEPSLVEGPPDYSYELEEISDALSQLEAEYQAWIEECWNYQGDTDAEYYKMQEETETEFQNRREGLLNERQKLETEYQEQLKNYEDYQQGLAAYEMERDHYTPIKISFDKQHLTTYDLGDYLSCEYLGENVYKLLFIGSYAILDMNMQGVACLWDYHADSGLITDFESGTTMTISSEPADMKLYNEGNAELIDIDFPEYRGKHEYTYGPFYNGYALMTVQGADGLPYYTIIDKKGNFMFDLKEGFEDAYISEDGKYLLALNRGSLTVFNVNGEPLTKIETMNIRPAGGDYIAGYNVVGFEISEGIIRFGINGCYVNVEDGTIIGSTYMTADDLAITKF